MTDNSATSKWLQKHTFYCPKLKGRFKPSECDRLRALPDFAGLDNKGKKASRPIQCAACKSWEELQSEVGRETPPPATSPDPAPWASTDKPAASEPKDPLQRKDEPKDGTVGTWEWLKGSGHNTGPAARMELSKKATGQSPRLCLNSDAARLADLPAGCFAVLGWNDDMEAIGIMRVAGQGVGVRKVSKDGGAGGRTLGCGLILKRVSGFSERYGSGPWPVSMDGDVIVIECGVKS